MLRTLLILSVVAFACAQTCFEAKVTVSGSLCSGGTVYTCLSQTAADASATSSAAILNAITSKGMEALGDATCKAVSADATRGSYWTDAGQVCPKMWSKSVSCPNDCSTATVATTTAGPATTPAPTTAPKPICCSSIRDYIANWCKIPNIDTMVKAGAAFDAKILTATAAVQLAMKAGDGPTDWPSNNMCADKDCQNLSFNAATSVSYSIVAMLVAALLAFAALF